MNRILTYLEYLLKTTNINFDIIAISETRITKNINNEQDPQQEEL